MVFNARFTCRCTAFALLGLAFLLLNDAKAVTIAWSPVGNAGNAADSATGFGAVGYDYKIGTYDVTNAQYTEFLNAKDPLGANSLGLYDTLGRSFDPTSGGIAFNSGNSAGQKYTIVSGLGNHPVNYVTWYDAIRFANWVNNGQGSADTESGSYNLFGGTAIPLNIAIQRNSTAHVVLPSENEWYKSAYYDPTNAAYFKYPTASNTAPSHVAPPGPANSANYLGAASGTLSDVGAYNLSESPYHTFDQGGNINQWLETARNDASRFLRGGSYSVGNDQLESSARRSFNAGGDASDIGIRLAVVPEPSTGYFAFAGAVLLLWWRCRYQ